MSSHWTHRTASTLTVDITISRHARQEDLVGVPDAGGMYIDNHVPRPLMPYPTHFKLLTLHIYVEAITNPTFRTIVPCVFTHK